MQAEELLTSLPSRVFLSSTSRDLKEHREIVRERCTALGYDVILMEEFGAQDTNALGVSLKEVSVCDVFVGVYARRYGYIPPGLEASVTEQEYDEAKRLNKPRLIFVVLPDYVEHELLEQYRDDGDPAVAAKIDAFLQRVGEERVWDTFTTPQHLASRVVFALSKWEGWRKPQPPLPARRYVGRRELLDDIQLSLENHRRVALLGIGGIGKTLTALQLAQALRETFTGGILFVSFGPEANNPGWLLDTTMRTWMQYHHPGRLVRTEELNPAIVRSWLEKVPGNLLIVFDDIWHIDSARELLRLIPDNATLLLTTRRADIARQLDVEAQHEIDRLSDADGFAMLRDRVGDITSRASLRQIVEVLDGHPLALEIIAGQIKQNGPDYAEELPALLAQNLEQGTELSLLQIEGEARQSSVEAALALTYNIMSQDLRRRFRVLGVIAPDAVMKPLVLAAVWGVKPEEPEALEDATDRMQALVSSGVLSKEPGQFLFHMHGLLRTYARGLLKAAGEAGEAENRYTKLIVNVSKDGFEAPQEDWRMLDVYLPHIHYIGDQLVVRTESIFGDLSPLAQPEPASLPRRDFAEDDRITLLKGLNFATAVSAYIIHRPQIGEAGRRWLQMGLVAARALNESVWSANILTELGLWHGRRGEPEIALRYYEQAMPLMDTTNNPMGEAYILNKMGLLYSATGYYAQALELYERTLTIYRKHGERLQEAINLVAMGTVYRQMGQLEQALALYWQALPVMVEDHDLFHAGTTLNNVGLVYRILGQPVQANEAFEQALPLHRAVGNRRDEAITLENMAGVCWDMWQIEEASALYEQALAIKREIGDRPGEIQTLLNRATVYQKTGQYDEALKYYTQALPVLREMGNRAGEAACLNNIGVAYLSLNQPQAALSVLENALSLNQELGDRLGQAKVLNVLGDTYYKLRQAAPTESYYQQGLALSREVGDQPGEAQILQNLGILYHALGLLEPSLAMYEQSLQLMRAVGNRNGEAVTLNNMASVFYAMKQPQVSIELLEASLSIMHELGDERSVAAIAQNIRGLEAETATDESTEHSS